MNVRAGGTSPRRSRWLALALVACAAACADAPPKPDPQVPPNFDDVPGDAVAPLASTSTLDQPTGPDLLGFPAVTGGASARDFSYEEGTGPLKGYVTRFYRIRHVVGATLVGILNNWKSPQGRIIDVPLHNMLIITELKDTLETMERVLEHIDRVPPQVEIEAKVIEIRRSANFEFGFELHLDRSPAANTAFRRFDGSFNSPSFLDSLRPGANPFQGASINWAAVGKAQQMLGDFEYVLRALERDGYAEVLSAPRVVVHSGHRALLSAKTEEPILVNTIVNTNLQNITTTFKPVGVTLEVTPVVVGTEAILLDVKPTVSSVVSFVPSPTGLPIPRVSERSADTQVDLRNGEILVIGGLYEKRGRRDATRIPIIGRIPLLGKFFSSIDDEEIKTDVIFILKLWILTSLERAEARLRAVPGSNDRSK